jgi:hypothetical protein
MFTGAHAAPADNHANRGMAFEEQLKWQHALYHRQGVAKMDKQYIPSLPVKDGKWAKVIGKSTVDFVGVLNGGFFLLTLWMIPKRNRSKVFTRERLGVMLLTINLCFFGLNIGLGDASRMAALFGPYLVILIPRMLTLIENRARRREAATLIVMLSGIQYILRLCINNIGGTLPYTFCW